jgi:hypothetical protein
MLRERVAPGLRELGFRGSGQRFHIPSSTHWALLGFQKSKWSDQRHVSFTINMTVVSHVAWEQARQQYPWMDERPRAVVSEDAKRIDGYWHSRIGKVMPDKQDKWWDLGPGVDVDRLALEVVSAVRWFGLPEMRRHLL